ncbi:MAG TPA: LysM domain-containing protein [Gaiellaceae bacterium]|nr:LysM domain-containing protein [Gaiellaceae bacterium]
MRQYAAPAASLLAVTAAVLAVHYGLQQQRPAAAPAVTQTVHARPRIKRTAAFTRIYVVQRGDSFSVIAAKTHTTVAALERLNPKVSPTALRVGQHIKVK